MPLASIFGSAMAGRRVAALVCLGLASVVAAPARAAESDLQQWTTLHLNHPVGERWELGLLGQVQFNDDITHNNQQQLSPSVHFVIGPLLRVGAGFTNVRKSNASNENRLWQQVVFSHRFSKLVLGHRLRIEERFVNGISGMIVRGRYRLHAAHPIFDGPWYAVAADEVSVNLNNRHTGPEHGFEQNRLSGGIGVHLGPHVRIETGYTWRFKDERDATNRSDHIIGLKLFFTTRGKPPPRHPSPDESHR